MNFLLYAFFLSFCVCMTIKTMVCARRFMIYTSIEKKRRKNKNSKRILLLKTFVIHLINIASFVIVTLITLAFINRIDEITFLPDELNVDMINITLVILLTYISDRLTLSYRMRNIA